MTFLKLKFIGEHYTFYGLYVLLLSELNSDVNINNIIMMSIFHCTMQHKSKQEILFTFRYTICKLTQKITLNNIN